MRKSRKGNSAAIELKVVILGDAGTVFHLDLTLMTGVGKSSILSRFFNQGFNRQPAPTLGAAYMQKKQKYYGHLFNYQVSPIPKFR